MSQYLNIFLKKKDAEVSLCEFCTTPARQVASIGAFPYVESDSPISLITANSYLTLIIEEKNKYKKYLEEIINKNVEIKENLYKCSSKEVAQMFIENIEDNERSISELKETIDEWEYIISRISFALDVWKENDKEWDLYYSNC